MVQISLSNIALIYIAFAIRDLSGYIYGIAFLEIFKKFHRKTQNFTKWTKVLTGTISGILEPLLL